jgi:hypothetical protein
MGGRIDAARLAGKRAEHSGMGEDAPLAGGNEAEASDV